MSLRALAKDLYRVKQDVERLEGKLAAAPLDKRMAIEEQLRKVRSEYNYMQRALDGKVGR